MVFRVFFCLSAQELYLMGLRRPYWVLRIKLRWTKCKTSALLPVISRQPHFCHFSNFNIVAAKVSTLLLFLSHNLNVLIPFILKYVPCVHYVFQLFIYLFIYYSLGYLCIIKNIIRCIVLHRKFFYWFTIAGKGNSTLNFWTFSSTGILKQCGLLNVSGDSAILINLSSRVRSCW